MKPLGAQAHGYLDYLVGLLLLASPWLFQFDDVSRAATITMVTVGLVVLGLSLLTDYPLGAIKAIPFRTHGVIETLGAIFLLASPWMIGYTEVGTATMLAVVVSIAWLGVVAFTDYTYRYHRMVH